MNKHDHDHEDITVEFEADGALTFLGSISIMVGLAGAALAFILIRGYWS